MNKAFLLCLILLLSCTKEKKSLTLDVPAGGDFSITTTKGEFDSQAYRGKTIFLFFGFTQCPYICPTTLGRLNKMLKEITPSQRKDVAVLFVSVDTKRDTLKVLKERIKDYPENFYAGTDTDLKLHDLIRKFGGRFSIIQGKDSTDIIVDHTASVFVINGNGVWVNSLNYDASVQEFKEALITAPDMSPVYAKHRQRHQLQVIGEDPNCDLAQGPCELEGLKLSISPHPVTPQKTFDIEVTDSSSLYDPVEIDFQGVDLNMGYIRPSLTSNDGKTYKSSFHIPICELPKMRWRARLIVQDKEHEQKVIDYYFNTVDANF